MPEATRPYMCQTMTGSRTLVQTWALLAIVAGLLGNVHAQSSAYGASPTAFTIRSPYRSTAKSTELLNRFAVHALLHLNFTDQDPAGGGWKTTTLPGVEKVRTMLQTGADGSTRTLEIAMVPHPEGGYDFHIYSLHFGADGGRYDNPDLPGIKSQFEAIHSDIQSEKEQSGPDQLAYQTFKLSYVQNDRALALLKALGYVTVEFTQAAGETLYDRIYAPYQSAQWKLPVVIKLIDAAKTSLMDPSPTGYQQQGQQYGGTTDLGGTYLHNITSGEPQQRLLIVYDKDDPESMESLLNLLRTNIDQPARQIVIEALVIEVNTDRVQELGLNIRSQKNNVDVSFEQDPETGADLPFTFIFNRNAFSDVLFFRAGIKAMLETGDAEVLSNPSVLVLDGRQARIQVGQQVPVSKAVSTTAGFTSGVEYIQTGIVLNLRPRVSEDGSEITMQVETIVSAVNQAASIQRVGDDSQVLLAPTVDNRQVQSFVRVADNTPFIIGGLIDTEIQERTVGIPILSQIPILGIPFRRKVTDHTKKEVIVVLTPHVVPVKEKNFSYVIPKDSEIFDSFGNQLFRNAYRVRDDDVFDLKFLTESQVFQNLLASVQQRAEESHMLRTSEPFAGILNGAVPGEEVLVRRMLWEIVHKTGFADNIDPERIIVFEDVPEAADSSGFRTAFLHRLLEDRKPDTGSTLVLTFNATDMGSIAHPFVQPKATFTYDSLSREEYLSRLMTGNRRGPGGDPSHWTILLSELNPAGVRGATALQVLQGVLVLKRILALNGTLPLTVDEFRVGRQIIFPTEQDLQQRYHIVDRDAAQFFFEVIQYYPEFERAFNRGTHEILSQLNDFEY